MYSYYTGNPCLCNFGGIIAVKLSRHQKCPIMGVFNGSDLPDAGRPHCGYLGPWHHACDVCKRSIPAAYEVTIHFKGVGGAHVLQASKGSQLPPDMFVGQASPITRRGVFPELR